MTSISAGATPVVLESIYAKMLQIRAFDDRTAELYAKGQVKGTAHSYVGEEAIASGLCSLLTTDDYVLSYHRGHGHCLAKGAHVRRMMAELLGRETGYCRGLGGSMHVADLELHILGANGVVGASMPIATGAALASQLAGAEQVAVAFFGDGAVNQGVFAESLNLAAIWRLPVIFVCENNQYALTTRSADSTAGSIVDRARGYGIEGLRIDGNDVKAVLDAGRRAISRAREGGGPTLIEALTYRWGSHSMRVNVTEPRTPDEVALWKSRDPIKRLEEELRASGVLSDERIAELQAAVDTELEAAVEAGLQSSEPSYELMTSSVYAPHAAWIEPGPTGDRGLSYVEALNEALHQEMTRDDRVIVLGEDVAVAGGLFAVTKGLLDEFGPGRVRDTPISEATFVGCGVGAAMAGLRPVVEIQIFDFVTLAMDQIVNQAAKMRFMLGGQATVPMVIRGPQGGGLRLAAQHSQSLEAWFAHIPGLVVVVPSTPYEAKGLLTAAIRDDNPVLFLEHKLLYLGSQSPVPEEPYAIPLGVADIKRAGTDVTLVAIGSMVVRALAAAGDLERDGISVEVLDPRTIRPLDRDAILTSVRKTRRLVVVQEGWAEFGFGAEVLATVAERATGGLAAPAVRIGAPATPMAYNDSLERASIPTRERIVEVVRGIMRTTG